MNFFPSKNVRRVDSNPFNNETYGYEQNEEECGEDNGSYEIWLQVYTFQAGGNHLVWLNGVVYGHSGTDPG